MQSIGIIAGGGQFPKLIAQEARNSGLSVVACAFHGHSDENLAQFVDALEWFHLGQFSKILTFFKSHGATSLCMAGAINKPKALELRPDFRAAKLIFSLLNKGDDSLLRTISKELEKEGFEIKPAADLVPGLRCPAGQLTKLSPSAALWDDIRYGWPIAAQLGRHDIGQCMVVHKGMVVAVECLEGTDNTLRRGGSLAKGCVAIKRAKPGQDERVDLPAVGLTTIQNLVEQGYCALALQATKTLFFDRQAAIALADKHSLAIVALHDTEILNTQ